MNIRRFQGWALILSAVIGLLNFVNSDATILKVVAMLGTLLFIFGVLGVHSAEPGGTPGLIGLILLELAALIAFIFHLTNLGNTVALVSAIAGGLGRLIVGWLTARGKAFSSWIGFVFMLAGLLVMIPLPMLGSIAGIIGTLVESTAEFGYGWSLARPRN
jgi:hypothetical protein